MHRFYCIRRKFRVLRLQIIMCQHEMFFYLVSLKLAQIALNFCILL